ncbi:MAG: hypothetical protein ACI93T_003889, partial [Porticoccaceae bacterium]
MGLPWDVKNLVLESVLVCAAFVPLGWESDRRDG